MAHLRPSSAPFRITRERLREVVSYDPATGVFTWVARGRGIRHGRRAGTIDPKNGYRYIRIDGVAHLAQRLAWLWLHGDWPARVLLQNDDRDDVSEKNLTVGRYASTGFDFKSSEGRSAYQKAYRARNRQKYRDDERARRFGITPEQYASKLVEQKGVCAICEQPETVIRKGRLLPLAVDHCHTTGAVRGLLCMACNVVIGRMGDNPDQLRTAAAYLERHAAAAPGNVVAFPAKARA